MRTTTTTTSTSGAVVGTPRRWLQLEGLAMFAAGIALFVAAGAPALLLVPLILVPDVSAFGYLAGPRVGAFTYNLAHTWAAGVAVLAIGFAISMPAVVLAGAVLVAHTGMDRAAGYGLKYPTAFGDTHLGRIGRRQQTMIAA
jgi:hypothetical protein